MSSADSPEPGAVPDPALYRIAASARLLIQLRLLLTAVALLLLSVGGINISVTVLLVLYALLSWILARYWERFVPHLLRHPILVTTDVFITAAILAFDGPSGAFFIATVLTSTAAGVLFETRGVAAVCAFQMLSYAAATASHLTLIDGPTSLELVGLQLFAVHPLLYPVAGLVGIRLRRIFTELAEEQEKRHAAERAAAAAQERSRLARDMHDSVAKTLRGAAMAAQSLPIWVQKDPERAAATAAQVADAAEIAAKEARELISDLRDDTGDVPIATALTAVVSDWSARSGTPAHVDAFDGDLPLLITARHETIAIVREALTNIDRHADATDVRVELAAESALMPHECPGRPSHLIVHIVDDGNGFAVSPSAGFSMGADGVPRKSGHFGLIGMVERAERAGGSLRVESAPGSGTRITLRVPLALSATSAEGTIERTVQ